MSQLKGEMIFSVRPDYNQNVNDSRRVVPDVEYKFGFDQDSGMQLSVEEIQQGFDYEDSTKILKKIISHGNI